MGILISRFVDWLLGFFGADTDDQNDQKKNAQKEIRADGTHFFPEEKNLSWFFMLAILLGNILYPLVWFFCSEKRTACWLFILLPISIGLAWISTTWAILSFVILLLGLAFASWIRLPY